MIWHLHELQHVFTVLEIMEESLDGDGSTPTMPDVTPGEAVRWIWSALDSKGYTIVKRGTE